MFRGPAVDAPSTEEPLSDVSDQSNLDKGVEGRLVQQPLGDLLGWNNPDLADCNHAAPVPVAARNEYRLPVYKPGSGNAFATLWHSSSVSWPTPSMVDVCGRPS